MECNGFTEDLQREVGPEYRVIFEPMNQTYEVVQDIPKERREATIYAVKEWNPQVVKDLKMFQYESTEMPFDEYAAMLRKNREIVDKHIANETSDRSEEIAHDLYHATGKFSTAGKRVF